jgi:hypothetical protein
VWATSSKSVSDTTANGNRALRELGLDNQSQQDGLPRPSQADERIEQSMVDP